eukprot:TRINITY_DN5868_c0_g1_i1.p1 TRINITY_DN5868_c0_g1~~TRINITY_DN5868_c0_g1_i1.p1  ORF type:complete len:220 (-),score=62.53 TRINITY_DN5868_c0_g1_i1:305-916(-)
MAVCLALQVPPRWRLPLVLALVCSAVFSSAEEEETDEESEESLRYFLGNLTEERMRSLYELVDDTKEGKVDGRHFVGFLGKKFEDNFLQFDADGDGKLTPIEFFYGDASSLKDPVITDENKEEFTANDKDGDGLVTLQEVMQLHMADSYELIHELAIMADSDKDGSVSSDEFAELLLHEHGPPQALALFAEHLEEPVPTHDEL